MGYGTATAGERETARLVGNKAEAAALDQLRAAGLTLIARNYLARGGELDLVMRDGTTLVFVEVRFRADGSHGDGLDSVSPSKQRRLVAAARQYLADHPKYARWTTRFDAVALGAGGPRWVKNVIAIDEAAW
jgi:putative endonuclease